MRVSKYGNKEKLKLICIRETLKHNFPFGSCTMCYFIVQNFIKKRRWRRNENATANSKMKTPAETVCVQVAKATSNQCERKIFVSRSMAICAFLLLQHTLFAKLLWSQNARILSKHLQYTITIVQLKSRSSHKQFYRSGWLSTLFIQWNIYSNIILDMDT